ncbi:MAG: hypothetical protein O3C57_02015 [Verrucomicrobia bacterium]|nr:hypothetical protein [Verrucomicrobiota bacterium]
MAISTIQLITGRLGWGQARSLPRENVSAPIKVSEKARLQPVARRRIVSQGRTSNHMAEFDHIVGRINYDVNCPLAGTRFVDYFSGNLKTVQPSRRREKRVIRNKVMLVLTVLGLTSFWIVARFMWPA